MWKIRGAQADNLNAPTRGFLFEDTGQGWAPSGWASFAQSKSPDLQLAGQGSPASGEENEYLKM